MDLIEFGTEAWPLRPSKLGQLVKCPMAIVLSRYEEREGGAAAQTGSVVHAAVEVFHREVGTVDHRIGKGVEALTQALAVFPEANERPARNWFAAYAADPKNQLADVRWLEESVRLDFDGVVIVGTLDQVRCEDGVLRVWDLKTGTGLETDEAVTEYQFQQAGYVLAARQTLDATIQPGGLIHAAGYDKPRGRRFPEMGLTVEDCEDLMREVVDRVRAVRSGRRVFTPSADACRYCPHKRYPRCKAKAKGLLG